jgi:hypothetical protein
VQLKKVGQASSLSDERFSASMEKDQRILPLAELN